MNKGEVKEEQILVQREEGAQAIPLAIFNRVLWKYEQDKDDYFAEQSKYRLGKILTIIDGAIADETQRKAIKDMVHDAWYSDHTRNIGCAPYTHMHDVQVALGIEQRHDATTVLEPAIDRYNPYKELVK